MIRGDYGSQEGPVWFIFAIGAEKSQFCQSEMSLWYWKTSTGFSLHDQTSVSVTTNRKTQTHFSVKKLLKSNRHHEEKRWKFMMKKQKIEQSRKLSLVHNFFLKSTSWKEAMTPENEFFIEEEMTPGMKSIKRHNLQTIPVWWRFFFSFQWTHLLVTRADRDRFDLIGTAAHNYFD